jgi:hypothetical protein
MRASRARYQLSAISSFDGPALRAGLYIFRQNGGRLS